MRVLTLGRIGDLDLRLPHILPVATARLTVSVKPDFHLVLRVLFVDLELVVPESLDLPHLLLAQLHLHFVAMC